MTRSEHEESNAFDAAKDAPVKGCHVCGEEGCRRPIVGCPKCDENMHEGEGLLCGPCDAEALDLEDRLDAYLHDGYDRARDAAGER